MPVFTARDDDFHFAEMGDRWWMTETSWFAFCKLEEKLGGWLYTMARPNIGTVAGGAWFWNDSAHLPWEVLCNANDSALRLPRDQDLLNITLPTGVSIKAVEPTMGYELTVRDGDECNIGLHFQGVMAPRPLRKGGSPFGGSNHFDRFGRVTGRSTCKTLGLDLYPQGAGHDHRACGNFLRACRSPPNSKHPAHRA